MSNEPFDKILELADKLPLTLSAAVTASVDTPIKREKIIEAIYLREELLCLLKELLHPPVNAALSNDSATVLRGVVRAWRDSEKHYPLMAACDREIPLPVKPELDFELDRVLRETMAHCETIRFELSSQKPATEQVENETKESKKLPTLQKHDKQAYQLSMLNGMIQQKIAEKLNQEHGTNYKQGQVSRMIGRAMAHAEASGLAEHIPEPAEPAKAIDPERLELGPRSDDLVVPRQRLKRDQEK